MSHKQPLSNLIIRKGVKTFDASGDTYQSRIVASGGLEGLEEKETRFDELKEGDPIGFTRHPIIYIQTCIFRALAPWFLERRNGFDLDAIFLLQSLSSPFFVSGGVDS